MQEKPTAVADDGPQYATRADVEAALVALTEADFQKLVIIAKVFCKQRCLSPSVLEPLELISEAVLKTLQCEEGKRWSKSVSLIKHLDRAMENISGHMVAHRMNIVAFPDGVNPDDCEDSGPNPEESIIETESIPSMLNTLFGKDLEARQVFAMRMEQRQPSEIQSKLNLTPNQYETVNRRILRTIAAFVSTTKA